MTAIYGGGTGLGGGGLWKTVGRRPLVCCGVSCGWQDKESEWISRQGNDSVDNAFLGSADDYSLSTRATRRSSRLAQLQGSRLSFATTRFRALPAAAVLMIPNDR